jgi:hypothetical protein
VRPSPKHKPLQRTVEQHCYYALPQPLSRDLHHTTTLRKHQSGPTQVPKMAPRSFEHRLYITMSRTSHSLAFLCRGVVSALASRLECISNCCAIYSFTGIFFTVSEFVECGQSGIICKMWSRLIGHCKSHCRGSSRV